NGTSSATTTTTFSKETDGWWSYVQTNSDVKMDSDADMSAMGGPDMATTIKEMESLKIMGEMDALGNSRNMKFEGGGDAMSQMKMDKEMNLGYMGLLLPKTSVSVGDTWTANNKFSLDMETSGM